MRGYPGVSGGFNGSIGQLGPTGYPPIPLSDVVIRKAKPTDKAQRPFDDGGLYLEITPAGSTIPGAVQWWCP